MLVQCSIPIIKKVNVAGRENVWSTAIGLTVDWALGTGIDDRTFTNDAIANSFRNACVINQARDY